MSIQMNSVSLENTELLTVMKSELSESEIVEIGIDGILASSESKKDIIPDVKDIDILYHPLYEDSIKSETIPENILESKHLESMETKVFVKTENTPFVKIENITENEILNKTEDTIGNNDQTAVEIQGSNKHFNTLDNLKTNKQLVVNFSSDLNGISTRTREAKQSKKANFAKCYKTVETTSWEKDKEKVKVIEAPVISVEPHEYTSLAKDKHVCNHCQHACTKLNNLRLHINKMHREVTTMYQCPYCPYKSKWSVRKHVIQKHKDTKDIQWFQCHLCEKKFKLKHLMIQHTKVHLTLEQMQDRLKLCLICGKGFIEESRLKKHIRFVHNKEKRKKIKKKCQECEYTTTKILLLEHHIKHTHKKYEKSYDCENCDYTTDNHNTLKRHKLIHLKPEEIRYFYCYHCFYKSKRKMDLKSHIFRHFKNEDVPFHCYICNFMTRKRESIIKHIKKHSKVQIKSDINE